MRRPRAAAAGKALGDASGVGGAPPVVVCRRSVGSFSIPGSLIQQFLDKLGSSAASSRNANVSESTTTGQNAKSSQDSPFFAAAGTSLGSSLPMRPSVGENAAQGTQDCDSELGQLERRLEARDRSSQVQDRSRVVEKPAELH
jgi:hypothetical protein